MLPCPVGLFKLILNLFCWTDTEGRQLYLSDFIEHSDIGLCSDACEPILFKHGMTLDTTKFYSLISVWMILTSSQGFEKTATCAIIL